jgi:hypothetical protein
MIVAPNRKKLDIPIWSQSQKSETDNLKTGSVQKIANFFSFTVDNSPVNRTIVTYQRTLFLVTC